MMQIFFRCRRCRSALSASASQAGAPYLCPACRGEMIVPACSERGAAPSAPARAPESIQAVPPPPPIPDAIMASPPPVPIPVPPVRGGEETPPPGPSVVKAAPVPPTRKFSLRLALTAAAIALLLAVGGLLAARSRSDSAPEQQTADAGTTADTPAPPGMEPARENAVRQKQATPPALLKPAATPPKPVVPFRLRGGKLGQEAVKVEPKPQAEPKPVAPARPVLHTPTVERRQTRPEEELLLKLAWAPQVGLEGKGLNVFSNYLAHSNLHQEFEGLPKQTDPSPLLGTVPRLKSLPFRLGPGCKLHPKDAGTLDELSRKLRRHLTRLTPTDADGKRPNPAVLHETLRKELRGKKPEWLRPEAISALMQILMHEDAPVRRMLVDLLAEIPGTKSTLALARRAVFDLDAGVRQAAINALKDRERSLYRRAFLQALRYQWAPAADHAAEALVALDDKGAVPELIALLKRSNPSLPVKLNANCTVVQELVRTNHFTNCLLCHPPALKDNDPVIGIDPAVAIPFTLVTATPSIQVQQIQIPVGRPGVGVAQQPVGQRVRGRVPQRPAVLPGGVQALGQSPFMQQLLKTAQRVSAQGGCHDYGGAAAGLSLTVQSVATTGQAGSPLAQGVPGQRPGLRLPGLPVNFLRVGRRNVPIGVPGGGTVPILQTLPQLNFSITSGAIPVLVRGDITYLRQDFSVVLPIPRAFLVRPLPVRFDFMVRTRVVSRDEALLIRKEVGDGPSYPQRESVLFALRKLTGKDAGDTTQAWLEMFPRAEQDVLAARLSSRLVYASGVKRENLLRHLSETKGVVNTLALSAAIPSLKGKFQERARQALVERLTRMTAKTLRDKFRDEDAEVRRAAVAASQRREKKELVPDLIGLLADPEPLTARAAEAALKDLTGQEHPSLAAWQDWWQKQ